MTNQTSNKPVDTLRDGAIKATIWRNFGEKSGTFYTVEISRTYTDEQGGYQDAHSFSGTEPLRVARLAHIAYDEIAILKANDAQALASS